MRKIEKTADKARKDAKGKGEEVHGRRTNQSTKFFAEFEKTVKADYKKRDDKKAAKASGKGFLAGTGQATSGSAKKYLT